MSKANWTQIKNMLGMTNLLLPAIVPLLARQAFHAPRDPFVNARKPASSEYRFQSFSANPDVALDTKTGNLCASGWANHGIWSN